MLSWICFNIIFSLTSLSILNELAGLSNAYKMWHCFETPIVTVELHLSVYV